MIRLPPGKGRLLSWTLDPSLFAILRKRKVALRSRQGGRRSTGHHPYREIICCLLKQTTITTACNRARESTLRAVSHVNSPRRPPESTSPLAKSFVLRQTVCK